MKLYKITYKYWVKENWRLIHDDEWIQFLKTDDIMKSMEELQKPITEESRLPWFWDTPKKTTTTRYITDILLIDTL